MLCWQLITTVELITSRRITADKKRIENGKGHDSDDSDRPKKKVAPKGKANGKSKGRA